MSYDRQVVLAVMTGVGDQTIFAGAKALNMKKGRGENGQSSVVFADVTGDGISLDDTEGALKKLTSKSRLIIIGHGDWKNATVGGCTGLELAKAVKSNGLEQVALVSIAGCSAARGPEAVEDCQNFALNHSIGSFAEVFHSSLNMPPDPIETIATAFFFPAFALSIEGNQNLTAAKEDLGKKAISLPGEWTESDRVAHTKRNHSKVKFTWNGKIQERTYKDYGNKVERFLTATGTGTEGAWFPWREIDGKRYEEFLHYMNENN